MFIHKQIYINKIKLPREIKDIIKDYIFENVTEVTKRKKNKLCSNINKTMFCNRFFNSMKNMDPEKFMFYIKGENNIYSFKICKNCGNYITSKIYLEINPKIKCNCDE